MLWQVKSSEPRDTAADDQAHRLADEDRDRQSPCAGLERAHRYTRVDEPEEKQRDLRGISPQVLELVQRVSRVGGASTKNPGSRPAWGRKGMIGTSASAECTPVEKKAYQETPPETRRYGQKL